MKRILYVMTSLAHKRVFESFEERPDLDQMIIGPEPKITSGIVPEDYRDFKIKKRKTFKHIKEIQSFVNTFKPDIYVQASLPCAQGIKLPPGCKKVFVPHGVYVNYMKEIVKKGAFQTSVWKDCDLYCCGTKHGADWVKYAAKVDDKKILLDAVPQLDIIHDPNYYNSYRSKVLAKTNHPNAKKVLLFIGFCCKDRFDFLPHNEDYFRSVIEMERVARKHDWLVMVKPRQTFKVMMKFLRTHGWGKKYVKQYAKIQDSKHLHFITTTGHIYRYFFADAIVMNGTSTVEVEACAIKKPLFIIRTCSTDSLDAYDMRKTNTAMSIPDLCELEHSLTKHFKDGSFHWPDRQEKRIKELGLTFDGKMHKRVQNKLARL